MLDAAPALLRSLHRKVCEAIHIKTSGARLNRNDGYDLPDLYMPLFAIYNFKMFHINAYNTIMFQAQFIMLIIQLRRWNIYNKGEQMERIKCHSQSLCCSGIVFLHFLTICISSISTVSAMVFIIGITLIIYQIYNVFKLYFENYYF